jgi:hypothetical protein
MNKFFYKNFRRYFLNLNFSRIFQEKKQKNKPAPGAKFYKPWKQKTKRKKMQKLQKQN